MRIGKVALMLWGMGALLASAGCDSRSNLQKLNVGPMVPVQGKVTLAGKPLQGGNVSLYLIEGGDTQAYVPSGVIDTKGNYTVNTSGEAGVPVGKYRVTVDPSSEDKNQDMSMDVKYASSTNSPLTINVTENPTPNQYDLKLEVTRRR